MMGLFLKYIIGGKSRASEFALFVFLLYIGGLVAVFGTSAWLYYKGVEHDFSDAVEFCKFITPWVLAPVFTVFLGKLAGSFGAFGSARQDEFE